VNVQSLVLLDVGASTGGFTIACSNRVLKESLPLMWVTVSCLEASSEPSCDGHGKTNIRYLSADRLGIMAQGAVIDVSFISLKLVIPAVSNLLTDHGFILALIKPQFEVGKGKIGKGRRGAGTRSSRIGCGGCERFLPRVRLVGSGCGSVFHTWAPRGTVNSLST
jgi:23S rRNA (cytidine1920-2'-O)/16S rRNA (cytidine1409-2'-O)-methyltransferase